jgi:hypothetical protein
VLETSGLDGEVIVADNGSVDASIQRATEAGARVIHVERKGYGNALRAGMEAARAPLLMFYDADLSYDAEEVPRYVEALRQGADIVMGSRLRGQIDPGAMPPLHRRFGTPLMTAACNAIFKTGISDINCGMRALTKEALRRLDLHAEGMELASEMIVKAAYARLNITEIPIVFHEDQRGRQPHLRSFRDGWRHLQLMLHFAPFWLFLIPGLAFCGGGFLTLLAALPSGPAPRTLAVWFAAHSAVMIGIQVLLIGLIAQGRVAYSKFLMRARPPFFQLMRKWVVIENGLVLGLLVAGVGLAAAFWTAITSDGAGSVRGLAGGATVFLVGLQVSFTSLIMGLFGIRMAEDRLPQFAELTATRTEPKQKQEEELPE